MDKAVPMFGRRRLRALLAGGAASAAMTLAVPALAQTYVYQNGQVDPYGPIVLTQDSILTIASGSATQSSPISGAYRITKEDLGTIVLTGANTWSGGTTVTAGTLQIGNGGTTGSVVGNISIATLGRVVFNRSDTYTVSSTIGGSGSIYQAGTGTTVVTGTLAPAFGAGVFVQAGVLRQGDGGTTGLLGGLNTYIDAGAAVEFNRSDTVLRATAIHGAGAVRQIGSGTMILTGFNDYTGGTTISAGTLQIGNGGASGAITGDVINNGALVFNHTDALTLNGVISGAGTVRRLGAGGVTTLSGDNTYTGLTTISSGTLRIGAGGTTGAIVGNVVNNGVLIFDRAGALAYGGAISGSGSLVKQGSGTVTFTGSSSYAGSTAVNQGGLVINGALTSTVTVATGALLGGTGSVGATVVNGTLSPGSGGVGTLTINGPLALTSGSVFLAEINGATSDRVNVAGTANLAGTLRLAPLGGSYVFSGYTLLSASGGRVGAFSTVDTQGTFGPGVAANVSYTAQSVILTLSPNALLPIVSGAGATGNERNVAAALDGAVAAGGDVSPFFPIYNLPATALPSALGSLTGEVHAAAGASVAPVAEQFLGVMLDPFAAEGRRTPDGGRGVVLWGAVFGSTGRTGGDPQGVGSTTADSHDGQLAFGADMHLGASTLIGAAISGGESRLSLVGDRGRAKSDVLQLGAYGQGRIGKLGVSAAVSRALLDTDTHRAIPVLGLGDVSASYDLKAWSARLDASLPWVEREAGSLSPVASLRWVSVKSPDIQERATTTAAALQVDGRTRDNARAELGLKAIGQGVVGVGALSGFVQAGWGYYLERDSLMTARFTGLPGSAMTIFGARPPRNVALISGGLDLRAGPRTTISAGVDGEVAHRFDRVSGWVRLRMAF